MLLPFRPSKRAPPPVCTPDTPASTCWRTCTCTGCARTPGGSPGAGQQSQGAAGRRHDDKAAHGVPNHVSSPCSGAHWLDQVSLEGRVVGRTEKRGGGAGRELKLKLCHQTKWSESVHNDKGILWPGLAVGRWAFLSVM